MSNSALCGHTTLTGHRLQCNIGVTTEERCGYIARRVASVSRTTSKQTGENIRRRPSVVVPMCINAGTRSCGVNRQQRWQILFLS